MPTSNLLIDRIRVNTVFICTCSMLLDGVFFYIWSVDGDLKCNSSQTLGTN